LGLGDIAPRSCAESTRARRRVVSGPSTLAHVPRPHPPRPHTARAASKPAPAVDCTRAPRRTLAGPSVGRRHQCRAPGPPPPSSTHGLQLEEESRLFKPTRRPLAHTQALPSSRAPPSHHVRRPGGLLFSLVPLAAWPFQDLL
jgi:hypothetical protein